MIDRIVSWLFRCRHDKIGIPVTNRLTHQTTVFCQSCGARVAYHWGKMEQGEEQRDCLPLQSWKKEA